MKHSIKNYLPRSLFGRTVLIIILPVLLLQIAVSAVFFERHWSKMTDRLSFAVAGEIAAVADVLGDEDKKQPAVLLLRKHLDIRYIAPEYDRLIAQNAAFEKNSAIAMNLEQALAARLTFPFSVQAFRGDKIVRVSLKIDDVDHIFYVPEGRLFSSSSYIFILWMVGLSIVLFAIALIFMRNQIRPIHRLGIMAERLGRGIPVGRLKPSGSQEIRQATEAFIRMQDRIQQFIDQRTAMLAGVSHDLKTPLTRMKLQLAMMGDTPDTDAVKNDIIDMERMIEGYLSFARGDGGEEVQKINLSDLLDKVAEDGRRLTLDITDKRQFDDDLSFSGKPQALQRALANFLVNASAYADQAIMETWADENYIYIRLSDNGPGVPDDQLQDILKPFFRVEGSRNAETGGVGLGMSIAQDIIASHAGHLSLSRSSDLGGLQIDIMLPY